MPIEKLAKFEVAETFLETLPQDILFRMFVMSDCSKIHDRICEFSSFYGEGKLYEFITTIADAFKSIGRHEIENDSVERLLSLASFTVSSSFSTSQDSFDRGCDGIMYYINYEGINKNKIVRDISFQDVVSMQQCFMYDEGRIGFTSNIMEYSFFALVAVLGFNRFASVDLYKERILASAKRRYPNANMRWY